MGIKSIDIERRILWYKTELEAVSRDGSEDELKGWYKSHLREMLNIEKAWLKRIIEEKTYENQGLNPPFLNKYL